MLVVIHLYLHREWKISPLHSPIRKPFSTKLPVEQILMGVKQNVDAVLVALAHYLPKNLDIREIYFAFVGLHSFPGDMQADYIKPPSTQVLKIHVRKRIVSIEVI